MIRFNIHNKGIMIIEVMIALALLALFGSTLFIAQGSLFRRISRTRVVNQVAIRSQNMILQYKIKMKQAELAGESIDVEPISQSYDNPEMTVTVSGSYAQLPLGAQDDQLYQSIFAVEAKAEHEFGETKTSLLLYKPQPQKSVS